MWFRNLIVYRLPADWSRKAEALEGKLAAQPLLACSSYEMESRGWTCPRAEGQFLYFQNRQWLLSLGVEQKLLPASIIRQVTEERIANIQRSQPHPVGRKQKRDIKEQVIAELMPRALARRRNTRAWIDAENGWLAVEAAGEPKAELFLETLRKTEDDLPVTRLDTLQSPAACMTQWLIDGEAAGPFSIDEDLELRSSDESKATVRYARHGLDGKDIRDHIAAGKLPVRLGMTWNDRISFVLTEQLHIKRLVFLDILKKESGDEDVNEDERFDIDFALMTGELSRMLADLVEALGGEKAGERPKARPKAALSVA
jgi:recombination associated protein RdgC